MAAGGALSLRSFRTEGAERRPGDGGRGPVASLCQGMATRGNDQAADQAGIPEAHLRLRRMDVNVHSLGRTFQEKRDHGMTVARQKILIGPANCPQQQPILYRPAINKEVLMLACRPVQGGQGDQASQPQTFTHRIEGQAVFLEFPPEQLAQAQGPRLEKIFATRFQLQDAPLLVGQQEGDLRMGHGEPLHRIAHISLFRARLLEKLQPRRRGEEKIPNLHPGAGLQRNRPGRSYPPAFHAQLPGFWGLVRPARQSQAGHSTDRWQRLPAKAEATDVDEVIVGQL